MNDEISDLTKALDILIQRTAANQREIAPVISPKFHDGYVGGATAEGAVNHLHNYWRSIRKHLLLIIGITLLITILVAIYVARLPDIYQSTVRVQVDLENPNPVLGGKNSSIIVNSADPTYFNTQLEILGGDDLMRRVAKALDLEHNQSFLHPQTNKNLSTWHSLLRMVGLEKGAKEDEHHPDLKTLPLTPSNSTSDSHEDMEEINRLSPLVASLQSRLMISQVKGTRLIEIRFTHPDARLASKVTNAIADVYVLSNLEKKTESNTTTGSFLQKRIAELQSQIRTGEEQLINYAKNNEILSLDANQNTVVERLAGLNKQLLEAENDRKLAEAAYRASLDNGAADALAQTGESGKQISDTESKLGELRQKRAQLLTENTEEWPEVKEVNQQIAVLEKQLEGFRSKASSIVKTNLQTQYRQALAREQSLRDSFNKQRGETLTQNEAAINYRIIQQEIETNKTLLDGLLQRSKENEVIVAGTPNNIHVASYAPVPQSPVGPARLRAVAIAIVLSLVAGIGLALFLEFLDDTVRSPDDVETLLQLPALAVIPLIGVGGKRRLFTASKALQLRNGNGYNKDELLLEMDQNSPLAEAYRQLRTSVLLSTAGRAPKTFLVTSSLPSEGKTTTVINTSLTLAQTGASVLVIDADMRRPRIHSVFGVSNRRGLSNILSREMSEADILSTVEQHDSGLYILPSGPIPPNPAELLGSKQMQKLISTMEMTFTHIVIDSPPVISFTDGVIISSMVDGVLLVVHGGKSSRALVRRSQKMLQEIGAKIFGVVLNKVEADRDNYYYKHYYHKYYNKDASEAETST